jgi:hypothetical protein
MKTAVRLLASLAIALLLFGCIPQEVKDALDAVKATNEVIVITEPFTETAYRGLLEKCVRDARTEPEGLACIDREERRWSKYVNGMDSVRKARCKLEPAKCAEPTAPSDTTETP